jgi:hypothetical protein
MDNFNKYVCEYDRGDKVKYNRLLASLGGKDTNEYICEINEDRIKMVLKCEYGEDIEITLNKVKIDKKDDLDKRLGILERKISGEGKNIRIKMFLKRADSITKLDWKMMDQIEGYLKKMSDRDLKEISTDMEFVKNVKRNGIDNYYYSLENVYIKSYQPYYLKNVDYRTSIWNVDLTINRKLNNILSRKLMERIKQSNKDFKIEPNRESEYEKIEDQYHKCKSTCPLHFYYYANDLYSYSEKRALNCLKHINTGINSGSVKTFGIVYEIMYDLTYHTLILNSLSEDGWHAIEYTSAYNPYIKCRYEPQKRYRYEGKLCIQILDEIYDYMTGSRITEELVRTLWHQTNSDDNLEGIKWNILYFKTEI